MRFTVLLSLLMIVFAQPSVAEEAYDKKCTCSPNSFSTRWAEAGAVFVGTVEDIKTVEKLVQYGNKDLPVEITLKVDDAFKGAKEGETFTLHTSLTRETCTGHPFENKQKYMIFAYQRKDFQAEYWSLYNFPSLTWDVGGLCGGTKLYTDYLTAEDLKSIAKTQAPQKKKDGFMNNLLNP